MPVHAISFTVDTPSDTVDANPGNGVCADAVANCSLRAAIQEANALASVDTINVPAGTYTLTISGTGEDSSATGDLDLTSDITITGTGSGSTFIDGNDVDRVLDILSGTVILSGLTFSGGLAPSLEGGGGMFVLSSADVTAADVVVDSNAVAEGGEGATGGGIYVDGDLTLNNSVVSSNSTDFGGGIYISASGTLAVDQTTIVNNADTLVYDGGGGIINNGGTITVTRSAIINNTNGGLRHISGTSLVENVTISGNTDFGLKVNNTGLTVTHSTITNNGASGITLAGGGIPALENTIVYGHTTECSSSITSMGYNLYGDVTCSLNETDQANTNPLLGPLADNGGAT